MFVLIQCCLVKIRVDLQALGWTERIILPNVFHLSFCSGSCEVPSNQVTFHSNILMKMIEIYKEKAPKAKLCCVPKEFKSYSIMYLDDDGTLQNKVIRDMEVKSCICT